MKTFYLQVQPDDTITDAITYPYEDYIPYEAESLPVDVYGGWFKLEDDKIVEYPELKPKNKDDEIEELKQLVADLAELVLMGGA